MRIHVFPTPPYPTCQTDVLPQNKPYCHSLSGHFLFLLQPKKPYSFSSSFFFGGGGGFKLRDAYFQGRGGYIFFSGVFFFWGGEFRDLRTANKDILCHPPNSKWPSIPVSIYRKKNPYFPIYARQRRKNKIKKSQALNFSDLRTTEATLLSCPERSGN